MRYDHVVKGKFISRPNRFIAHVDIDGEDTVVHVKNTGRCRELLEPGNTVFLDHVPSDTRKTDYDLVGVCRRDGRLLNMDSQAPNKVVGEWLEGLGYFDEITPEYSVDDSRIDFHMVKGGEEFFMEVKGCTLIKGDIGYFPDAPTIRGVKHIHELTRLAGQGHHCYIAFVIQTEGVYEVRPNVETQPEFGKALDEAARAGVKKIDLPCIVTEDSLEVDPGITLE